MILQCELEYKRTDFRTSACRVDKVVELPPAAFARLIQNPLSDHDFIKAFNAEKHERDNHVRSCLLVLKGQEKDGILIVPQGYGYARYSAYIPDARSLVQQELTPSLSEFDSRMRWLTDAYTRKALQGQIDGEYEIDFDQARSLCGYEYFDEDLLMDMLSDRPEFDDVEASENGCRVTVTEAYLRQENDGELRKLAQEEVEVMCARHILWLHGAGGGQADFSGCLLDGLDLSRKDLSRAVLDGAKFSNTRLCGTELSSASCRRTKIYRCDLTEAVATEASFKEAECVCSTFDRGMFAHSNFTGAVFTDCTMYNGSLENGCLNGTAFGDMDLSSVRMNGCSYDEQQWAAQPDGPVISM